MQQPWEKYQNVLVSLNGHTEGFVDFGPYLPAEWREPFYTDRGEREAHLQQGRAVLRLDWSRRATTSAFEIESEAGSTRSSTTSNSHQKNDGTNRQDGVAAELIIDGFGAITHDPRLAHQITLAFNRWFADTYLQVAPQRWKPQSS